MAAMTKQEMTRAMTLLEEDDLEELAKNQSWQVGYHY